MPMHCGDSAEELASVVGGVAGIALKNELARSFEETSIVILKTLLTKGYTLSGFAAALATICVDRNAKACGYFEKAEQRLQEDEGETAEESDRSYLMELVLESRDNLERSLLKAEKYRTQRPELVTSLKNALASIQRAEAVFKNFPIYTDEEFKS